MASKRYVNRPDKSFNEIKYIKEYVSFMDILKEYTDLKKVGVEWKGICPLHYEDTPSFVFYERTQSFHCFGCGKHGDVFNFLHEKTNLDYRRIKEWLLNRFVIPQNKLESKQLPREIQTDLDKASKPKAIRVVDEDIPLFNQYEIWSFKRNLYLSVETQEIYEYRYPDQTIAGYMLFSINEKTGKKTPLPVSLAEKLNKDGDGTEIVWALVGLPAPRPMFNLHELLTNTENKPVLVVEGERCATRAKELLKDFIVVTWAGGANACKETDFEPLIDREVYIWPDNDAPGKKAAEYIAMQLPNVEILEVPKGKPDKWDIADAIKEGKTEQEIRDFIYSFKPKVDEEEYKFDFDMPPGLLGELAQYILDASATPHPLLATGAALSILSVLQAQKVMTEDEIHPNLYILTLAPSGVGKNFAYSQVKKILPEIGCRKLLSGTPASGAGLISALDKRQGRTLMPIDEFGQVMQQILGTSGDNCRSNLVEYFLKLFSESNNDFYDIEYSDREKKHQQRIIYKPNLVIYGTGVPEDFYEAVNSSSALNGFLARMLVLEGVDIDAPTRDKRKILKQLPDALYRKLLIWGRDPVNIIDHDYSVEGQTQEYNFSPIVLPYQLNGRKMMAEYSERCKAISSKASRDGDKFKASIYNRGFELASKVALIARTPGDYIDTEAVEWAIKFVNQAIEHFYESARSYLHNDDFDKLTKDVQRYLEKKAVWADKRALLNRFRRKPKILEEVLDFLVQAGKVETRAYSASKDSIAIPQWRAKISKIPSKI